MKQPNIQFHSPQFLLDPSATKQMAEFVAKLSDIIRDIYDHLGTIPVVSSAPVATELDERGTPTGEIISDVKILDNATQSSRRIYYKYQGSLRLIESD